MSFKKLSLIVAIVMIASMLLSACAPVPAAPAPAAAPTSAPAAGAQKDPKDITVAFSGFSGTNECWLTLARAAEAEAKAQGMQFINLTSETQDAEAQKRAGDLRSCRVRSVGADPVRQQVRDDIG